MKPYQLTQQDPDFNGWQRSLVKVIAVCDGVTMSCHIVKFIDSLIEVTETKE